MFIISNKRIFIATERARKKILLYTAVRDSYKRYHIDYRFYRGTNITSFQELFLYSLLHYTQNPSL